MGSSWCTRKIMRDIHGDLQFGCHHSKAGRLEILELFHCQAAILIIKRYQTLDVSLILKHMGVSINGVPPSINGVPPVIILILMGSSLINHPAMGYPPIYGTPHLFFFWNVKQKYLRYTDWIVLQRFALFVCFVGTSGLSHHKSQALQGTFHGDFWVQKIWRQTSWCIIDVLSRWELPKRNRECSMGLEFQFHCFFLMGYIWGWWAHNYHFTAFHCGWCYNILSLQNSWGEVYNHVHTHIFLFIYLFIYWFIYLFIYVFIYWYIYIKSTCSFYVIYM